MSIDKKIFRMCKTAIRQKFGNLDDLPPDLANTVANIFYKSFELSPKWVGKKSIKQRYSNASLVGEELNSEGGFADFLKNIISYYETAKDDRSIIDKMVKQSRNVNNITEMIYELRKLNRNDGLPNYRNKVQDILDLMKYGIEDAGKKTLIMREIERDLKEKEVDEVPDLYRYI